jgi:eukaryotic-like serine/threonine-protein kinase
MGEVYRARDSKLNRDVAIKVLPEAVAEDAERLARFQREAQVLASLNHPHIAAIYGLEKTGNVEALVLELVGGETLAERVGAGPLPVDEALAIARQIADALEAAHEKGIVHRDLKPANVKVTTESKVKVLDFGLAKALSGDASSPDVSHSPTLTAQATQAGVVIGTAAYMSPEQARGKAVDKRADIWAFGAVLYEMLAGSKAFEGETVSDTLAAVLRADIDWSRLPPQTPPAVRGVLRSCLDRDPKHRLRDIGDARIALEDLTSTGRSAAEGADAPPVAVRRPAWPWLAALIAALLAGTAAGRFALSPRHAAARPVRFEISAGRVSSAAISPDGRQLAIASGGKLRVRDFARLEIREIEGTDGAVRPFWSPDSRTIAFGAHGKLWKVLAEAGTPSAICELASGLWDDDAGGAWLADGTIVFSNGNTGLWQVSAQGGDPVEVLKPDPKQELDFHTASALPDGRSVVYVIHRATEGAGATTLGVWSGGKARLMFESKGQNLDDPVYSPSGHILFARSPTNAGVWALPFSLKTLAATGEAFLVSPGTRGPSVASDGTLVVLPPRRRRPDNLTWTDRDGKILGHVDEPRLRGAASVSRGGDRIAAAEVSDGKWDIWLYDLRRNTRSRLTNDGGAGSPVWLKDGPQHPVREPHLVCGLDPAGVGRRLGARGGRRPGRGTARGLGARRPLVLRDARRGRMAPLVSIPRGRKAEARSLPGPGFLLDRGIAVSGRPVRGLRGMVRPRCVGDFSASLPSVRRRLAGVLERRNLAALVVRWTALLRAGSRHPGGAADHGSGRPARRPDAAFPPHRAGRRQCAPRLRRFARRQALSDPRARRRHDGGADRGGAQLVR